LAWAILETRPSRWRAALLAALVPALVWAHGRFVLSQPLPDGPSLRVGLVQASIRQDEKWDAARLYENFGRHAELTRRAAGEGARLIVWPESAVPWDYDATPAIRDAMLVLAREGSAHIAFGNDDREAQPNGRDRVFVGAKLIDPEGRLTLRYHKVRLVPFGEYVPAQPLLTLGGRVTAKLVQQVSDFTPGKAASVGAAGDRRLGVFICYEAIFPDFVRRFAGNGASLLVNITNDAWYGTTSAPFQHFAMTVFRAVENGRYLVRAANTGISGVVDPRGRVVARTELFERTVLVRDVPEATLDTFYVRHGDLFAWSCLAAALAVTLAALRPGRRVELERPRRSS
jgi:apolipoprotein N-acyltransferase